MRILHVISGLDVGGAETMLAKLLHEMRPEIEARVVSLTGDGPVGERIRGLGAETVFLGMRRGVPDPRGVVDLAHEIRKYRPALVQTWMYHADLVGGLAALLGGRPPVIWGLRNADLDPTTARWTTLRTLQLCAWLSRRLPALIVSCSERARDFHVRKGYDAKKIVVIPNGFDLSAFAPVPRAREEVRRELGLQEGDLVVGMVARYHPMKDFRNFARAADLASREDARLRFVLVGHDVTEANAELCGWLGEAGVRDLTRLLGRRSDVSRILAALDLFTLSSVTEGFPNALGEAMASGIPCVATDAGDSGYVLGSVGQLVPIRDPAALAAAWLEVLGLPAADRENLGRRARDRIAKTFSIEAVAAKFMKVYRTALREA